jgi:proteic killer suppression protein
MDVEFADDDLERMYFDKASRVGHSDAIVKRFRKVVSWIRGATDERDLYALKSLHFEKLKGKRKHQRSLRINDQWRLIVEIVGEHPQKRIRVIGIEDYH